MGIFNALYVHVTKHSDVVLHLSVFLTYFCFLLCLHCVSGEKVVIFASLYLFEVMFLFT